MMSKNKIAKLLLALGIGVATVTSGVAIAGCNPGNGGGSTSGSEQSQKYTVTFDLNGGDGTAPSAKEVEEGGKVTAPTNPSRKGYTFDGWYTAATGGTIWSFSSDTVSEDITLYAHWTLKQQGGEETKLTSITATKTTTTYTLSGGSATIAVTDVTVTPNTGASLEGWTKVYVLEKDGTAVAGEAPWTVTEAGTYTLKVSVTKTGETAIAATPITITVSGSQGGDTQYEDVTTNFDFAAAQSYGTYTSDVTIGKFTFGVGGKFETNSGNNTWNSQGKDIKVVLAGTENSIAFNCQRASSKGTTDVSLLKVNEDNTTTAITTGLKWKDDQGTEADGWAAAIVGKYYSYTATGLEKGTYIIRCNPSGRMTELSVTEKLPKGTPTNVTAENGIVDYLIGSHFDCTGMNFYLNYDNGRKDIISITSIDSSALDNATAAGEYQVQLSYELNGQTYTGTVAVKAYEPTGIELVTSVLNDFTPTVYLIGEKFDGSAISVNVTGTNGGETHKFYAVDSKYYSLTIPETLNDGGVKMLEASLVANAQVKDSFTYYVIPSLPAKTKEVEITVNPEGNLDVNTTKTIQQAIDYLNAMNLDEAVIKKVKITAGKTYNEKVIIDIPNTILYTEDNHKATVSVNGVYELTTKIVYNAINKNPDKSNHLWANDDNADTNATVVVTAPNVTIKNIVLENYWNTAALTDQHQGDDQALALFVNADKFTLENVALSSYQDTVQFKSGRAVVTDSYIEGVTDFIYGVNSTVYFYGTTIYAKQHRSTSDGGYITAFKGGNSASDCVEYGAVFDHCKFTAHEDELKKGNWAIARPWADYSAVTIINSELGAHISKTGYTPGAGKNARYVDGLKVDPTKATIKFYELNNSGDGALVKGTDAEVAGMHYLDEAKVADYALFSDEQHTISNSAKIFLAASNQNLATKYTDDWLCKPVENVMVTVTKIGDTKTNSYVYYKGTKITAASIEAALRADKVLDITETISGWYTSNDKGAEYSFGALEADATIYYEVGVAEIISYNYSYSADGLQQTMKANGKDIDGTDNIAIEDKDLVSGTLTAGGAFDNSWLHVGASATNVPATLSSLKKSTIWRKPTNSVLQIRGIGFYIEVKGEAELQILLGSTSSSNTSTGIGLYSAAENKYVTAAAKLGTETNVPDNATTAGLYDIKGTSKKDGLKYTLTEGTYYIVCTGDKDARIYSMSLVGSYANK